MKSDSILSCWALGGSKRLETRLERVSEGDIVLKRWSLVHWPSRVSQNRYDVNIFIFAIPRFSVIRVNTLLLSEKRGKRKNKSVQIFRVWDTMGHQTE